MVWTGSKGLNVNPGICPAATVTIIVSPMALDMAKITEDTIPDEAAGIVTLKTVCNRVEPIP